LIYLGNNTENKWAWTEETSGSDFFCNQNNLLR